MKKIIVPLILSLLFTTLFSSTQIFAAVSSPYYIEVNCTTNIVAVFQKDASGNYAEPIKTFVCSAGKGTPSGTFRTTDKYVWRPLFDNVYGQYATRITGHILFHSVPYHTPKKNDLEYEEYNKLGQEASAGCIRLCVRDTKWIYDNCQKGTTVKLYRGDKTYPLTPEPVGKTDVTDVAKRGWDPTDPDANNPWLKVVTKSFSVEGVISGIKAYNIKGSNYLKEKDLLQLFSMAGGVAYPNSGQPVDQSQSSGGGQSTGQNQQGAGGGQPAVEYKVSGSGQATDQSQASTTGQAVNGNAMSAEDFHKLLTEKKVATYNLLGETIYKLSDAAKTKNIAMLWDSRGIITLTAPDGGTSIAIIVK